MSLTFSFALGQNQTFELRYQNRTRPLPLPELTELVDWSEASYYSVRNVDEPTQLVAVGRTLYHWLDGSDGWLRGALANGEPLDICLDLVQTMEVEALNPETQRVALGLAHLPWELLHDGQGFLLGRQDVDVSLARQVQRRNSAVAGAQNRPLRLLFMATEPEAPGIVSLSYEQEEANILTAIQQQRQTLDFVPEESGAIQELGSLVQSYAADHFDVFHLTGHGIIYTREHYGEPPTVSGRPMPDHTPCFVTEDELGQLLLAAVPDLAKAFRNRWPRVIFLSGCHTGQVANGGTVPSMAAGLIRQGASVVLGWARPVFDDTAIVAATAL